MWQQQVLPGVVLRTVLLPVWILRLGGCVLLPDLGVPGKLRDMRGIFVDDDARRAIDDILVNEQLIHIDSHNDDNLGDHQHQLFQQQRERQPDTWSPARPDPDHGRHVWKQQVMYSLAVWTMLFPVWILWLGGRVLLPDCRVPGELWDL